MPGSSDSANRPLPSILTRSFSWMRIFLHHLSSCSPSFDKCLEKCSKKFSVTGGNEPRASTVAISVDWSQLAQPKQIAFVVLAGVRGRLRRLPNDPAPGACRLRHLPTLAAMGPALTDGVGGSSVAICAIGGAPRVGNARRAAAETVVRGFISRAGLFRGQPARPLGRARRMRERTAQRRRAGEYRHAKKEPSHRRLCSRGITPRLGASRPRGLRSDQAGELQEPLLEAPRRVLWPRAAGLLPWKPGEMVYSGRT